MDNLEKMGTQDGGKQNKTLDKCWTLPYASKRK